MPDRTAALLSGAASPVDALAQGAASLRRAGAEVLAIACNTAHHWYDQVRCAFDGQVLHIAEAVADELALQPPGNCTNGRMATPGTVLSGFYRRAFERVGLVRSEAQTSELHTLMSSTYAVFCWKKK